MYFINLPGTDEKAIIDVLAFRSNEQRMQIKLMYKTMFGRVSRWINDFMGIQILGHGQNLGHPGQSGTHNIYVMIL